MSSDYQEYLELFEYFGRGGMVRLRRVEFEALTAEIEALLALKRALTRAEAGRYLELQQLLFRERPRLSQLAVERE